MIKTLVFEYDGGYWHGEASPNPNAIGQDIKKTEELLSRGYIVVRVRQTPLEDLPIDNPSLIQLSYKATHSNKLIPETLEQLSRILELLTRCLNA
jgi:very-short-patch-repair endonuclease